MTVPAACKETRSSIHLSVVIPAYNEEERLPATLLDVFEYLSDQSYAAEVIVVDDGSTDDTKGVVQKWEDKSNRIRLVSYPDNNNRGKGAAVILGMREAHGSYRIFMDADNSTTLDQIDRFWPWLDKGYDIVIGSRSIKGSKISVHQPWYKEHAGRLGNLIIRRLAVPGIADTQAGFKMFTRRSAESVFPRLTIERWGYDVELLVVAQVHGYRIREVPITWVNAEGSKVNLSSYFQVLSEVLRIRTNLHSGMYL